MINGAKRLIPLAAAAGLFGCALFAPAKPDHLMTMMRGLEHMQRREYREADALYAQVPRDDTHHAEALAMRGLVASILGEPERGIKMMKEAEALNPEEFKHIRGSGQYESAYSRYITRNAVETLSPAETLFTDGDILIVGSSKSSVSSAPDAVAYDLKTRRPLWSVEAGDATDSDRYSLGYSAGVVLVPRWKHRELPRLAGVDAQSGKILWESPIRPLDSKHGRVRPVADENQVYIGLGPGAKEARHEVIALNLRSGVVLWRRPLSSQPGPLGLGSEQLFFRTKDGALHALSTRDGAEQWSMSLPAPFENERPVAAADMVYLNTTDRHLYAIDAAAKAYPRPLERVRWEVQDVKTFRDATPGSAGGLLVIGARDQVLAFNGQTGVPSWKADAGSADSLGSGTPYSRTTPCGDLFLVESPRALSLFDSQGRLRWRYRRISTDGGWEPRAVQPMCVGSRIFIAAKQEKPERHAVLELTATPEIPF